MSDKGLSNRRLRLAGAAVAGLTAFAGTGIGPAFAVPVSGGFTLRGQAASDAICFAYENILGTSMDLAVRGVRLEEAQECRRQILAEIQRLAGILSTYDPSSEISRYKAGGIIESPELSELLGLYDAWAGRTGGAINVNMAEVIRLWKQSAADNVLPTESDVQNALNTPLALNVDALGKGYIIDRAIEVARRIAPAGILNIGGDIRAWGDMDWSIGVTDPFNPSDNAPLIAEFPLREAAVATSGGYARFYTIGGKRYSHIIDPLTGWPVEQVTSATAIAGDCLTANAISTAASVLGISDGSALAGQFADGHLLVDDSANQSRGGALALAAAPAVIALDSNGPSTRASDSKTWPADYQLTINLALGSAGGAAGPGGPPGQGDRGGPPGRGPGGPGGRGRGGPGGGKRPYVAVWIEDAKGKLVRTLSIWGNDPKYTRELSYWWQTIGGNSHLAATISRATRSPGAYSLTWDGKDDQNKPVPTGKYTVFVEVNREHGRHVRESAQIACTDTAHSTKINATAESQESTIEYGPKTKS